MSLETAAVAQGALGTKSASQAHPMQAAAPLPLDPGRRAPIVSAAKAGQTEYRCKNKAYHVTVLRRPKSPVFVGGQPIEAPEQIVDIRFTPTLNGYGSYILGADPHGFDVFEMSTPEGMVKKTANQLREEWFALVLGNPVEMARAGLRPGALWKATDERALYVKAQAQIALAALRADPEVMKAVGDAWALDPTVGKTMKPAAPAPVTEVVPPPPAGEKTSEAEQPKQ